MVDFLFFPSLLYRGFDLPQEAGCCLLHCLWVGLSKWEISHLLLWTRAADHSFCSASCRGGGCCQHWWAASAERPTAMGAWNHEGCKISVKQVSCLTLHSVFGKIWKQAKRQGHTHVWFTLSSSTLGSWLNPFRSMSPTWGSSKSSFRGVGWENTRWGCSETQPSWCSSKTDQLFSKINPFWVMPQTFSFMAVLT